MVYINRTPEELAYLDSMEDSATDRADSPPPHSRGDVRRPVSARSKGAVSDECSLYTSNDLGSKRGRPIWEGGPVSEDRYLRMQEEVFRLKVEINKREDQHKQLLVRLAHAEDTVKKRMREDIQQNCIASKAKSSAMGRIAQQYLANEKVRDLEHKLRDAEREIQKKREHIRYYKDQALALKKQLEETMRANWTSRPSSASRLREGHMVQRLKEQLMELRTENFKLKAKLSQYERVNVLSKLDVDNFSSLDAASPKKHEVEINAMYTILRTNRANESQAGPKNDGMYKNQAHEAHEICEELVDDANDADVKNQLLTSWAKMDNLNALYQKSMEELHSLKQNHERALQKLQETNMDVNDLNFTYKDGRRPETAPISATTSSRSNLSTPKSALSTPKSGVSKIRHVLAHQRQQEQDTTQLLQQQSQDQSVAKDNHTPMEVEDSKSKSKPASHVNQRPALRNALTIPPKKDGMVKKKNGLTSEKKKQTPVIFSEQTKSQADDKGRSPRVKDPSSSGHETLDLSKQKGPGDDELQTSDSITTDKVQECTKLDHDGTVEKKLLLESHRTLESDQTLESECTQGCSDIEDECVILEEKQDVPLIEQLQTSKIIESNAGYGFPKDHNIILTIRCLQLQPDYVDPCIQSIYVQHDFLTRFSNKEDQCTQSIENVQSTLFYSYTRVFPLDKEKHQEAREALKSVLESEYSAFIHFQIMGTYQRLDQQYKIGTSEINLLHTMAEEGNKDDVSMELDVKSLIDKSQTIGKFFVILQGLDVLRSLNKEVFHGQRKTIMSI